MTSGLMPTNSEQIELPAYPPPGDWKFKLLGTLAETSALRVFTAAEFHQLVLRHRPGASTSTARLLAHALVQAGALRRVASGMYLNRRCLPPAELNRDRRSHPGRCRHFVAVGARRVRLSEQPVIHRDGRGAHFGEQTAETWVK